MTLEQRIDSLLAHTQGTMPVWIEAMNESEAASIHALLGRKRHKAKHLVTVVVRQGDKFVKV